MITAQLKSLGKKITELGLAWGTSGNISGKISADSMVVSASGSKLSYLQDDELVRCSIANGTYEGDVKPSKEYPMHQAMYTNQKDANVVIHCSPFYTTMISCSPLEISTTYFVESIHYLRNIEWIDYFHPGTDELAKAVERASAKSNIIIMKNHGVILSGKTMDEAIMKLEVLEMTCRMIVEARKANIELISIDQNRVLEFKERDIYKSRNL